MSIISTTVVVLIIGPSYGMSQQEGMDGPHKGYQFGHLTTRIAVVALMTTYVTYVALSLTCLL